MYRHRNKGGSRARYFRSQRPNFRSFDPSAVIEEANNARNLQSSNDSNGHSPTNGNSNGKATKPDYKIKNKFSDFPIDSRLAQNIINHKYETPTPIQDRAIPHILSGRDVVGIANTGTGKTAAFLIPLINKVVHDRRARVLIVTPTRELAVQIEKELYSFSRGLGIHSAICIGGVNINGQIKRLRQQPHFVIGTPGRLMDLESRRNIDFGRFDSFVLDEVDRMLDMGFIGDVKQIVAKLPRNRQSLFFSATLEPKVKSIMNQFINNPVIISVKTTETRDNVHQSVIKIKGRNKADVLCELLDQEGVSKSLIFMRTKRSADKLHKSLSGIGFQTAVLHGNKSQNQSTKFQTFSFVVCYL